MAQRGKEPPESRRRWTAEQKAAIVRRYLQGTSLADLADETGATPGQISQWRKQALAGSALRDRGHDRDTRGSETCRYVGNRSEWLTRESLIFAEPVQAIRSAARVSLLVIRSSIDQPTTRRLYRSSTTARYSQPSVVGM